jgi:hypothetical protein
MDEVRLGEASVSVLPVVRGLPSDGDAVADTIASLRPDRVALSVSPEELETLRTYRGGDLEAGTVEEEAYVAGLSAWEEPVLPPPCFTRAVAVAVARKIPLDAVDMDEEAYTDAYTTWVSTMELLLQGRMESRLLKKRFRVATPREFAVAWDAEVNRTVGFARLQKEREKFMASRLREVAEGGGRVLAVIEVERVKGVLAALRV